MNLYRITELNDENSVVLITLYYLRSKYLYLGNPPFLTLTIENDAPSKHIRKRLPKKITAYFAIKGYLIITSLNIKAKGNCGRSLQVVKLLFFILFCVIIYIFIWFFDIYSYFDISLNLIHYLLFRLCYIYI